MSQAQESSIRHAASPPAGYNECSFTFTISLEKTAAEGMGSLTQTIIGRF